MEPAPPPFSLPQLVSSPGRKGLPDVEGKDAHWEKQIVMPFAEFRKASNKVEFWHPAAGQPQLSIGDEWIRLRSGERWNDDRIGFVSDMWPMVVEAFLAVSTGGSAKRQPARYWYPTLLLNLDIKKSLGSEGVEWLFARVRAKQIRNGRMDLEVVILDNAGEIVALSHHVCLILGAERNLAVRREHGEGSKM